MATTVTIPTDFTVSARQQPSWFATCTSPRHEKSVARQLLNRGIEHLLPLYRETHLWKQRRAEVDLPLFPGYIFVRIPAESRLSVLQVPGVAQIISLHGRPVPLPDEEMEALQAAVVLRQARPHPYLAEGQTVRIRGGALRGLCGVVERQRGACRMIVAVDFIQRAMSVELDASDLECIG